MTADRLVALKDFRIVDAEDDGDTPVDRWPWRRGGIYCSPICLAVHLEPFVGAWSKAERDRAKDNLFRYLRQCNQRALDHGMICPLAAVIEVNHQEIALVQDIQPWGSDQGWHRGGFTLYPETTRENVAERLEDLLKPHVPRLMDLQKEEPHDLKWYVDQLEKTLTTWSSRTDTAGVLASELLKRCQDRLIDKRDYSREYDKLPILTEWYRAQIQTARDLADRETAP